MNKTVLLDKQQVSRWGVSRLWRSRLSWGMLVVAGLMALLAIPASAAWPNLPYGTGPGQWDTINELLGTAANYDFANGQKMTINGTICGDVANASSVNGNGLYSNTGIVYGSEWVGATGPIHSTYTSQGFGCQWYTPTSGFPVGALPACDTTDPKNEPSDQLFMDMAIASNTAKDLTPTQTFASLDTVAGDVTVNVVSGLNVINIPADPVNGSNGKLTVRGAGNLIISGPADATVIFNVGSDDEVNTVSGGMDVSGSSILVTGGVQAQNVFFNVLAGDVTANGGSNAPGEVINGSIIVRAGSDVKGKFTGQGYLRVNGSVLGDGNHSSEFSTDSNNLICKHADRGDAPDTGAGTTLGNYNTLMTDNGPFHVVVSTLKLGSVTDTETDGQPTVGATGDDNNPTAGPDDEEGVIAPVPLSFVPNSNPAITVRATNTTGSAAFLRCWMDLNKDGDFLDTGEASGTGATTVPTGGASDFSLNFGTLIATDTTYLRCRLSSNAAGVASPVGPATSSSTDPLYLGEVEDYAVQVSSGAIGNYVWVDENEDGYQDAGEPGLGNVTLQLRDSAGVLVGTRITDANGGYLFTNLAPGNYTVQVDASTLPVGMHQTTNPVNAGADFGNQSQPYSVSLAAGEETLTADFGYVWGNPNDNTGKGAIGDRVWIDSDGDGAQDAGEPGLGGIQVKIYYDSNGDGVVDPATDAVFPGAKDQNGALGGVTTTEADGSYIFSELPAGAYVVVVTTPPANYTQTGDPDDFGTPATAADNRTTAPVVLAPGDVFLNADFGYQPTAQSGANNTLGDRVWFDNDADGIQDAAEKGIAGVTLALLNNAGVIIATDTTDANGVYLFGGLPDGTYTVKVNDTDNVLANLSQSGDPDAVFDGMSTVVNLGVGDPNPAANLNQDFGYTPVGQQNGEGLIGDTIFLNVDGDNTQDAGEPGIEGVKVNLLNGAGQIVATTTTNENGSYYFGNLNPLAQYSVVVAPENFAAGGVLQGLNNTADPDGGNNSQAVVNLGAPGSDGNADEDGLDNGINLGQDFGYTPPAGQIGRIGNLIWRDTNANGVYEAGLGETPIGGVTLNLYRDLNGNGKVDSGDPLVSTTSSAASILPGAYGANGNYIFGGLPAGKYVVDVTDEAGILLGQWHSAGAAATDNNSQLDPYAVSLGNGNPLDNLTADFGYYIKPAAIGDFVWNDLNYDGLQNLGETGIAGVKVMLTITYPNGDVSVLTTLTGSDGFYSFNNLLMDEDYDGVGVPGVNEPRFVVTSQTPDGLMPTLTNQGVNDMIDSDDPVGGEQAEPIQGSADNSNDFGFVSQVSAVIGNYVWLDENADGYQDAGEPGLPNVRVQLFNDQAVLVDTAQTDVNGGYLFRNVAPGTYIVQVDPASLPSGLTQTTNPINAGADFGNQTQPYLVTVGPGVENLTADFGYMWGDPNGNTGKGAIGDRVWIDSDGDGVQDAGESGLGGIEVTIYYDSNNDGIVQPGVDLPFAGAIDQNGNVSGSTLTEPDGSYIFHNLPAAQYVIVVTMPPSGYTQTGDPDDFGDLATAPDNRTTTPIVLAPGDVFLNVDFGYRPNTAPSNTIGDTIYLDANGNGSQDVGEPGIPSVTVALLDNAGNIIATDFTDANGLYLFPGLPNGTYTVKVTDADNVLGELAQTGDPDGTLDEMSTVAISGGVSNLDQDFGYAPPGHSAGEGLIGDTIFMDRNSNGLPDSGEGIERVTVRLYDAAGVNLLGITVTNEDGLYYFGNLNPAATYRVVVDTATLLPSLFNTIDPDGGFDSWSLVNLSTTPNGINLDQDFGYDLLLHQPTDGVIGDTIFLDINNSGQANPGEGLAGVTVQLYDGSNVLIGVAVTDANGLYYFPGLPAGFYKVVVDTATLPPGLANTVDPDGGNNSQSTLILGVGQSRLDQDFGYRPTGGGSGAGTIGDTIYLDANGSGAPNAGEGLPGVVVYLYNSAGNLVGATTTNASGVYTFNNLPAGTYTVVVNTNTVPNGLVNSVDPDGGNDSRSTVTIGNGNPLVNLDQDFGYAPPDHNAGEGLIGDTIFLDANSNGVPDAGEGLPGVRVELYDSVGNLIATATTDSRGLYYFGGLPAGTYTVKVDTTTVPGGLVNTIDPDGGNNSQSTLTLGNGNPLVNLNQDFGYAPSGQNAGEGLIGDTIFLDIDGNYTPNAGEGISGVTVRLFNSSNTLVGTTTTDANGLYYFGNLTPDTYKVVVDSTTLPTGLTNTVDPDGVKDNQTLVTIGGIKPLVNLDQDFGYVPTSFTGGMAGAIGNQFWLDVNANGVYEPGNGESGIAGVTVDLYWDVNGNGRVDPGEPRVGSQTTDANGRYLFTNLPVDTAGSGNGSGGIYYVVDVTDIHGALTNYWHSLGTAGIDSNSQTDPYGVMLTPVMPINLTADFGYYVDPAAVGDYVWFDEDKNGIQNTSLLETPLSGVAVTLTITYPNGVVTVMQTYTNVLGKYVFGNLLLDEDFNGVGTPGVDEPLFIVTSGKPQIDYVAAPQDQGGNDNLDSDDPTGAQAMPVKGQRDVKYDFGWVPGVVTAVSLANVSALDGAAYSGLVLVGSVLLGGTFIVVRRARRSADTHR